MFSKNQVKRRGRLRCAPPPAPWSDGLDVSTCC